LQNISALGIEVNSEAYSCTVHRNKKNLVVTLGTIYW